MIGTVGTRVGLTIGVGDLHVWRVELDIRDEARAMLPVLLDDGERAYAGRLRAPRDRDRYVVAHGALRSILGAYLQVNPASLEFERTRFGKPSLADAAHAWFQFNTSRSGGLMACALARNAPVGVDIEEIAAAGDTREDSRFSAAERAALANTHPDSRAAAIAACWTRKEAFVKARGLGVSLAFESFDVSVPPEAPRLIATRPDPDEAARWTLAEIAVPEGYTGTVAIKGEGWRIMPRVWPDDLK
jgi:4'-phosphopantetheinyl transferase